MGRRPDKETLKLMKKHLGYIRKKFNPKKIVLFGSRARGDYLKDSDIDLLIVSDKFENLNWRERIINTFGDWDKKQMLEPICLTSEEFEKKKKELGIVRQAVKEGIEIK